jgi:glycosyltransferase involved in cell wall biosynthesis
MSPRERTLLLVAYFFPPLGGGGVQRWVKLTKYLRPLGWRSEVVTVKAQSYWVVDETLAADVPEDTVVHRTASWTGLDLLRGLRRRSRTAVLPAAAVRSTGGLQALRWLASCVLMPDAYLGWVPFALAAARARIETGGIDVLLTTSSPDSAHLVGLVLRERTPVPWVADFRDPWVRRLTFQAPTPLHAQLQAWLEGRVLARADCVLVTNEATRADFLARYPELPKAKLVVLPNGFDPSDLEPGARSEVRSDVRSAPSGRRFVLAHTGLLSGKRSLAPLLQGLRVLFERRPELRSRLLVRQIGPRESVNDALVRQYGLSDVVEFGPPRRHPDVLQAMATADGLLLIEADEPQGSLITPGKIFEYLAVGRPILALVPRGPAADLITEFDAGVVVPPGDAAAIAATLAGWLTLGPPEPGRWRGAELGRYSRPVLAERLNETLRAVVNARDPADLEPVAPVGRRRPESRP